MANIGPNSSSNNDKKGDRNPENIIIIPPFFHIDSCTMSNNINQTSYDKAAKDTNEDPPCLSSDALNHLNTSHIDPSAPGSDDALTLLIVEEEYAQQRVARENAH
jgi:hypothetical protein